MQTTDLELVNPAANQTKQGVKALASWWVLLGDSLMETQLPILPPSLQLPLFAYLHFLISLNKQVHPVL